jgi:hypothetical protein
MSAVRFASRGRRERSAARRAATSWSSAPTCPSFSAHSCTPKLGSGYVVRDANGLNLSARHGGGRRRVIQSRVARSRSRSAS